VYRPVNLPYQPLPNANGFLSWMLGGELCTYGSCASILGIDSTSLIHVDTFPILANSSSYNTICVTFLVFRFGHTLAWGLFLCAILDFFLLRTFLSVCGYGLLSLLHAVWF